MEILTLQGFMASVCQKYCQHLESRVRPPQNTKVIYVILFVVTCLPSLRGRLKIKLLHVIHPFAPFLSRFV